MEKALELKDVGDYISKKLGLPNDDWLIPYFCVEQEVIYDISDNTDRLYETSGHHISFFDIFEDSDFSNKLPQRGECIFLNENEMRLVDELVDIIQTVRKLSNRCGGVAGRLTASLSDERFEERKKKDKRFYYIEKFVQAHGKDDKIGQNNAKEKLRKLIT
uniref:Uncharacterized protein n=1 Tax=Marseillevirus LCMAC102 TaxID=2506603 RepID=A0A481YV31_9VIRU|nr:MAG: hypothetical protein LCMAC102_01610 [Marseillevirus LCMAC102]